MSEDEPELQLSGGGPVTPDHKELKENGQQKGYIVLSPAERAKGFVRPLRHSYKHVGAKPKYPTRPLTDSENQKYSSMGYTCFEIYPESESPKLGRFWTKEQMAPGCGTVTTMSNDIAETYARNPKFYGGTFCAGCGVHLPLDQFVWNGTDEIVGS